MKTIGILGGMSYESSLHYYDRINRQVNDICGDLTSCRMFLYSVNFEEIRKLMLEGDWEKIGAILSEVAKKLESVGCDYVAIATNTIHKVANIIEDKIGIPLIHIADCVSEKCHEKKVSQVLLLGTRYTMTEDFLKNRLEKNGLTVVVPEDKKEIEE
ncbi:MAG: amino acid racemase, partial [Bacilli bacterium]|nr:amino acid racemase [Bacilli bacterium]